MNDYPHKLIEQVLDKLNESRGKSAFGAYQVCPRKRFINEQDDEEVVLWLRSHPITYLKWGILALMMIVVPETVFILGRFDALSSAYVLVVRMIWYLGIFAFLLERFLSWHYSVFIVTNERVVDINFVNLLTRVINYANLNHIESPSMVSGGLARSLFHYGDVYVSTAAEGPVPQAESVPYPDRVIAIISELSEELEKRRERGE